MFAFRFDRCICIYDYDKIDKPKEAFKKVKNCHKAGILSMAFDPHNNVLLTGSVDGNVKLWSLEGRWVDRGQWRGRSMLHSHAYLQRAF